MAQLSPSDTAPKVFSDEDVEVWKHGQAAMLAEWARQGEKEDADAQGLKSLYTPDEWEAMKEEHMGGDTFDGLTCSSQTGRDEEWRL